MRLFHVFSFKLRDIAVERGDEGLWIHQLPNGIKYFINLSLSLRNLLITASPVFEKRRNLIFIANAVLKLYNVLSINIYIFFLRKISCCEPVYLVICKIKLLHLNICLLLKIYNVILTEIVYKNCAFFNNNINYPMSMSHYLVGIY